MSSCIYNGIEFSMIHVVQFDQESVLDKTSTDYLYTKCTIKFDAILSQVPGLNNPALPPGLSDVDTDVADTVTRIRSQLETPRARLQFYDGDRVLDTYGGYSGNPGAPSILDVKNGPFPKVFAITRFDGGTTYHVSMMIETYIIECTGNNGNLLSHRWTERLEMDSDFTATYSRDGFIALSTRLNSTTAADTQGRPLSFVPLKYGYRREYLQFVVTEDALGLQYSMRDVMIYRQAPQPALKAEGQCVESSGIGFPYNMRLVTVKLTGPTNMQDAAGTNGAIQQRLLNTAVAIALNRLLAPSAYKTDMAAINGGLLAGNAPASSKSGFNVSFISRASLTQDIWNNRVEVMIEAQVPVGPKQALSLPFNTKQFIFPILGCPTQVSSGIQGESGPNPQITMPIPQLYGQGGNPQYNDTQTSSLILIASAMGIPCKKPSPGTYGV